MLPALSLLLAPGEPGLSPAALLASLVAVLLATKLLGALAQHVRQPAVLGELVAGVLLGTSVLGLLDPADPVIRALAEIGVLILLFEIGLHTDLGSLLRVGRAAGAVALAGMIVPLVLGYAAARLLGLPVLPAIVCGAALTATSIGISARVLSDLGQLETTEGQVVLGAAVADDVGGLIVLSVVAGLAAGGAVSVAGTLITAGIAIGFVVAAIIAGRIVAPPLFRAIERVRTTGALGMLALAFAFLVAWLAAGARSAPIIGAFAAGLVLHPTPQRPEIQRAVGPVGLFFVPIFFASVGAEVDVRTLGNMQVLAVGLVLVLAGVVGKFVAGYAPWWLRANKPLIGAAMIPRGEVGLIFAQMGLATGALDVGIFSAVTLAVMVTTFVAPPLLGRLSGPRRTSDLEDRPGDGGIDDLVAGTSISSPRDEHQVRFIPAPGNAEEPRQPER